MLITGDLDPNVPARQSMEMYYTMRRLGKDCIFLQNIESRKVCVIYPVRPNQCRTWPFWSDNLTNSNAWNKAAQKCPAINKGKLYTREEIEKIRGCKKWWQVQEKKTGSVKK